MKPALITILVALLALPGCTSRHPDKSAQARWNKAKISNRARKSGVKWPFEIMALPLLWVDRRRKKTEMEA